jgi:hypothetical protein
MIKGLVKLATHLDQKGYRKEAGYLDEVLNKLAEDDIFTGDTDWLDPSGLDLDAIVDGDTSAGEVAHEEVSLEDRVVSEIEYTDSDLEPSRLESILGGDLAIDILDTRDADALWRGIKMAPDAMAQWFFDTMNAVDDSDMDSIATFARVLGERVYKNNSSDDEQGII